MVEQFRDCYNRFFSKYIRLVQPHYDHTMNNTFDYKSISTDVKQLIANYTFWDEKLYQFAKQIAIQRSKKVLNAQMW